MARNSGFPSAIDLRAMANDDLIGVFRFCRSEVDRLKRIAERLDDMVKYDETNRFLREVNGEMSARCLACPA